MRITDTMLYTNASTSIDLARSNVNTATEESSSGLRVTQPGDDPAAAAGVIIHSAAESFATSVQQTATAAVDELQTASGALNSVSTALTTARELAVQMSNDTYNATDRADAAAQVGQIFNEVVAALNTKSGDRYVFGGSQDQTPPFDASGNYNGDTEVRTIEVAPGVQQPASLRADVAITGAGGGTNVLAALTAFQTALTNNDTTGIEAAVGALQTGTSQVAQLISQAGGDMDALSTAATVAQATTLSETKDVSNLQDADVVTAATQLQMAQTALQAALAASTQSFKFSLLDQSG